MAKLKNVGVREFRDHATAYLSGSDPVERDREEVRRAVEKLESTINRIREETGMSEEELARLFDLRRSLPE